MRLFLLSLIIFMTIAFVVVLSKTALSVCTQPLVVYGHDEINECERGTPRSFRDSSNTTASNEYAFLFDLHDVRNIRDIKFWIPRELQEDESLTFRLYLHSEDGKNVRQVGPVVIWDRHMQPQNTLTVALQVAMPDNDGTGRAGQTGGTEGTGSACSMLRIAREYRQPPGADAADVLKGMMVSVDAA